MASSHVGHVFLFHKKSREVNVKLSWKHTVGKQLSIGDLSDGFCVAWKITIFWATRSSIWDNEIEYWW